MRTDLASEARSFQSEQNGITETVRKAGGFACTRITVETQAAARRLDKPVGQYLSIEYEPQTLSDRAGVRAAARFAASELVRLLPEEGTALVVGLGNRYITADALGTKTAERVLVTRHLLQTFSDVLPKQTRPVAAVCTGVLGVTGIETVEIVSALARELRPAVVLIVDSLAAADPKHLGTVLQMNDTGIAPGAGVGNYRAVLSRRTLGVPVIALGIPLVIPAQSFAEGDWEEGMYVTPKDVDLMVKQSSDLLAETIDRALHPKTHRILRNLLQ